MNKLTDEQKQKLEKARNSSMSEIDQETPEEFVNWFLGRRENNDK